MQILRAIIQFFFEILFGCRHDHLTRPFTLEQQTYKVCLDCGKQIYYSPVTMRALNGRELRRMQATQLGEVKVLPVTSAVAALVGKAEHDSNAAA